MFFGNTKIAIYLGKTKIMVGDHRHPKASYFELSYQNDLPLAFNKIVEQLPSKHYKIILGRDVSYTVRLDLPEANIDRPTVSAELIKHIPEVFEDGQFDWRIDSSNKIVAVVVASSTYHSLQEIRAKYPDLVLETQSATSILWEMGKTADEKETSAEVFAFATQQGRGDGKDEAVLNVEIEGQAEKKTFNLKLILPILIIVLGLVAGTIWLWTASSKIPAEPPATPVTSTAPSPAPSILPAKNRSDYRLTILNGTNKVGFANETKIKLEALGFTQIETGNAEEDSQDTTITLAEALPDSIQNDFIESLAPLEPIITIAGEDTTLQNNDIVIVLGTK